MKSKSGMPKKLEMNPQSFDIELRIDDPGDEDKNPTIFMKFGSELAGEWVVTKTEANKISKWFAQLAKAIK